MSRLNGEPIRPADQPPPLRAASTETSSSGDRGPAHLQLVGQFACGAADDDGPCGQRALPLLFACRALTAAPTRRRRQVVVPRRRA